MKPTYHYTTVSEALTDLKAQGFTHDFNLREKDINQHPENYKVQHVYRYEGDSDPDDEAVVYGILNESGEKGVFVAGFAANSENDIAKILSDLCNNQHLPD